MAAEPSPHHEALRALELAEPTQARLATYLDTLAAWSRRVNLTGASTAGERVERLVTPVLPLVTLLEPGSLIDVGSGNGSPGLVLALLRDDLDVTLLEPRTRRWAFLREAARRAGGSPVRVVRSRHDTYAGESARTVTIRALALPLSELEPLVAPGGRVIVLGRRPAPSPGFEPRPDVGAPPDTHVFHRPEGNVPRGTFP